MSLSWPELQDIVVEAKTLIVGSRLQQLYCVGKSGINEWVFEFYSGGKNHMFYCNLHQRFTGAFFIDKRPPKVLPHHNFQQYLHKHLCGQRLTNFSQAKDKRLLSAQFENMTLQIQLMHLKANLLLLDSNKDIVRTLKTFDPETLVDKQAKSAAAKPFIFNGADSLSKRCQTHYAKTAQNLELRQSTLEKQKIIKKQEKKIKNIQKDLVVASQADQYKQYGEAIKANLHDLNKAKIFENEISLSNPKQTISLPISGTANELMDHFFRQYKKMQRRVEHAKQRIQKERQLMDKIAKQEISPITTSYLLYYDIKPPKRKKSTENPLPPGVKQEVSDNGYRLWIGRNASGNENILKNARGNDLWLHVKGYPGSHCLVIRQGKKPIPHTVIQWAAKRALAHSKGKKSGEGEVEYTMRTHVRRFKGAAPGQVIVQNSKTIYVRL